MFLFIICAKYISGEGGIGKSTALKNLCLIWAENQTKGLQGFSVIFHIALKYVKDNTCIEDLIINQHNGLFANDVRPEEINNILKSRCGQNILVLLDGYDEYSKGPNEDIDDALRKRNLWDCWFLLTSRPFDKLDKIKPYMDAEAVIKGFTEESIKLYATRFFSNESTCLAMLRKANKSNIRDILYIPIILQMVCVLYLNSETLPMSRTGLVRAIVERCIQYSSLRKQQGKVDFDDADDILFHLGRIAWETLQNDIRQLLIDKVVASM